MEELSYGVVVDPWRGRPGHSGAVTCHFHRSHRKDMHVANSMKLVSGMMALVNACGRFAQTHGLTNWFQSASNVRQSNELAEPLLHRFGARRVGAPDWPILYSLIHIISLRAGLPRTPDLYWLPVTTMNAFAFGEPDRAIVVVTHGLLCHLTVDELAGILAHEIAHIRNNDHATMALAQSLTSVTEFVSFIGLTFLWLAANTSSHSRTGLAEARLLLCLAPAISRLLELALSRLREFDADLDAVELTGCASGLMRALQKLEYHHSGKHGGRSSDEPGELYSALLRTHPDTASRVRSLFEVSAA